MKKIIGLYVGSFDPVTNGHLDIIRRASLMFDELDVGVASNSAKHYHFDEIERCIMLMSALKEMENYGNIKVFPQPLTEATTDIMIKNNINVLVRGIRNSKDAEDELLLNSYYKQLKPDLEEVLLITNYPSISSTFVNECIKYKKFDVVSKLVPASVMAILKNTTSTSLG